MPSYKPKVQVLLTQEYHEKFKVLCEKERRSDSVMGAIMIEKYIDEYEAEHGEITLPTPSNLKYGDIVTEERIEELYAQYEWYQPKLTREMFKDCLGKCLRKTSKGVSINQEKLNRLVRDICGY